MKKTFFTNCLFFALKKWITLGGYIVIRKSDEGWFPHFIWCGDLKDAEIEHIQPVHKGFENPYLKKFWFESYISKEDKCLLKK